MKLHGVEFDGSSILFDTQEHLQSFAGTATWLTEFRPKNYEYRNFIELLLKEFCAMGICCVISGTFPAYRQGCSVLVLSQCATQ
jgi:hypothetical protein